MRFDPCERFRLGLLRMIQIAAELKIHPEICRHPEVFCQAQSCTGRDPSPSVHQLIDALVGHMESLGQFALGESHGLQEFLQKNVPWMRGRAVGWDANTHSSALSLLACSMVVNDFHICWPRIRPAKTDAVLIINTNAMLSLSVPFQGFQAISWGHLEFMK